MLGILKAVVDKILVSEERKMKIRSVVTLREETSLQHKLGDGLSNHCHPGSEGAKANLFLEIERSAIKNIGYRMHNREVR